MTDTDTNTNIALYNIDCGPSGACKPVANAGKQPPEDAVPESGG